VSGSHIGVSFDANGASARHCSTRDVWRPPVTAVSDGNVIGVRLETDECATSSDVCIEADHKTWEQIIRAVGREKRMARETRERPTREERP
jgi:hypothetical protein